MTEYIIQAAYLAASILFIIGLKSLTRPDSARRGMQQAAVGMLLAIVGTLLHHEIVRYDWIIGGLVVGTVIGIPLGFMVPMTAMPQRIAISHMFGALAATLVGIVEYREAAGAIDTVRMAALGFEVVFGALTVTGSFMAFGKLQELVPGRPVTYPGQNAVNIALFVTTIGMLVYVVLHPLAAAFRPLGALLSPKEVESGGSSTSPNVLSITPSGAIEAPSMRFIADMADPDNTRLVNFMGQSGHPASPHYEDQFEPWLKVESQRLPFTAAAVAREARHTLTLAP